MKYVYYDYNVYKELMIGDNQYNYLGNYSPTVTYVYKDVVDYSGKKYIALATVTGLPNPKEPFWSFLTPLDPSCNPDPTSASNDNDALAIATLAYDIALDGTRGEGRRSCSEVLVEDGTIKFNAFGPRFQMYDTYNGNYTISVINPESCREIKGVISNTGSIPSILNWGNYTSLGTIQGTLYPGQTSLVDINTIGTSNASVLIFTHSSLN